MINTSRRGQFVPLVALLLLLSILITPIAAIPPSSPPFLQHLPGRKIPIVGSDLTISSKENTWVSHGWTTGGELSSDGKVIHPYWTEMSPEQKREFLNTAAFRLLITPPAGDPYWVELTRRQWFNGRTGEMWIYYYVVFPSYTFESGKYTFEGYWYLEYKGEAFTHYNDQRVGVT